MNDWTGVTLIFPAGTKIVVPPTHEILGDGRLQATFTREELRLALELFGSCVECYGLPPCESCTLRRLPRQAELFSIHA
jgi:hypothetical protein